jgi:hypothetical protein
MQLSLHSSRQVVNKLLLQRRQEGVHALQRVQESRKTARQRVLATDDLNLCPWRH